MNRRRCLSLLSATSAASLLGNGCQRVVREEVTRWRGVLFNSDVDMAVHAMPPAVAEPLIRNCELEMQRLEKLFSLYLPDSPLSRLNRTGRLDNPPPELVDLVRKALLVAERSGGAFDPTIQPYWTWLRETVETTGAIDPEAQAQFLEKVDFRQVRCGEEELSFGREGMALTLNGLSQGWITDRATKILRDGGAQHCLVNLGEFYGLGTQPSGRDWIVGLRGVEGEEIALRDRALAVSSGAGLYFGTGDRRNHIIDPRTGDCVEARKVVAVTAPEGWLADALSTACSVLEEEKARDLIAQWEGVELFIYKTGR
ncbi:MAG: FAD:protein FMN transferase [Roseibacillus sp.]